MAEQTSHNVVINSESTGASAQVDAAANNSTTDSAPSGKTITTTTSSNTLSETLSAVGSVAKSLLPNGSTSEQTGMNAKPSAGEAGHQSALKVTESHATKAARGDLVNGVHEDGSQPDGHADDKSTAGGSVDLNVLSDTDNPKVDAGEKASGHARTSSTVKKPAGFSKVNATKSFLSKITPSAPTASQAGDKREGRDQSSVQIYGVNKRLAAPASSVLQPANRPRLIAKTGTSQSMLKPRMGSTGAGAPDASKVWNKNQPVVAPPPKQLTDEELKQQFGIHLATRLQTDGDKKDSNWADIDDDEDDWAPETVVWMDGTKSTVPKDATPVPGEEEQKIAAQPAAKTAQGVKPALALKQRSDRPERPMQILKPGATTIQARQNGGLAASSPAGQKAPLTAKNPAAAPAKSPWAPVPKPDSVAPINPPVQAPPPPRALPSQDARASEPLAPTPAREIAADTFDRSWQRDSAPRELFNSSNGRYEPAPEGRRGSMRQDNSRKPAVLQRPAQTLSPAPEPSAAFQSRSSSSQMDGSWGSRRRRDSSASQGSMPGPRRMSMNKAPEFAPTPEVPSAVNNSPNSVASRPNFDQRSAWDKQMPPPPGPQQEAPAPAIESGPPPEDPVKVQERIMQEKREAAKRRKEEEAREEAAKQERLKAKLAALEGAGKSRSERAAEAASKTTIDQPAPATEVQSAAKEAILPAKPPVSTRASSKSPPVVETPAPAQQQQQPPEKMPSQPQPQVPLAGLATRDDQTRPQPPGQQRAPAARTPFGQQQQTAAYRGPTSSYSSPGDRKSQPVPLGRSPGVNNDSFSPWPTTTNPNNNIWGSGFGNGVFEGGSAFAPMATSQQNSSLPPPPGMSRAPGSTRISPQGFNRDSRSPSLGQPQLSEQQRAFPAPGMSDRSAPFGSSQPRLAGVSPSQAPGYGRPHHPPGPIGPPSRAQHQNPQQQLPVQRPLPAAADASGWAVAATNHMPNEAPLPEHRFKETFKRTSSEQGGKLGGPRKLEAVEHTIHDGSGSRTVAGFSPAPPSAQTQPIAPPPAASPAQDARTDASSGSTVRMPNPSQNPAHGGLPRPIAPPHRVHAERLQQQRSAALATAPLAPNIASKEQFAPPPEVESHPVYSGDARHPQVRLPKAKPVVRLPQAAQQRSSPQMQSRSNGSVVMPAQRQSYRFAPPGAVQPIVANESWQHRFNGLFGRAQVQTEAPPSPPGTPPKSQGVSLAVASSSIEPMATQTGGATVSLPRGMKAQRGQTVSVSEPTSKPEMDFNNERSFGSLPRVKVPSKAKYHADAGSLDGGNMLKMIGLPKSARVDSGYHDLIFFWRNPMGIFVKIPFTRLNNKLCIDPNYVEPAPKAPRPERKSYQQREQRDQQAPGGEQQQFDTRDRKHSRVNESGQPGPGTRKPSQAFKNAEQQQAQSTEDRKPSGKFANKKFNERDYNEKRENRKTGTQDARLTSTPPKGQSAALSKRSSVQVTKEHKSPTPPPYRAAPVSAKEAMTDKRKSGVTKPSTPSASANRFGLLATMASPSKA